MLRTRKNCRVCKTILSQPKRWDGRLAKRIYQTRHFRPSSNLSLVQLAEEYKDKFSYESLLNHVKKHQVLSEKDFNERHLRELANQAEKTIIREAITSGQVWNKVITKGMEGLESGEIQLGATHLLTAARDKSNFEMKQADQQLALMDMVYGFASGETLPKGVREDTHVIEGETVDAGGAPASSEGRENRSRSFYESLAGNAAPSGSD